MWSTGHSQSASGTSVSAFLCIFLKCRSWDSLTWGILVEKKVPPARCAVVRGEEAVGLKPWSCVSAVFIIPWAWVRGWQGPAAVFGTERQLCGDWTDFIMSRPAQQRYWWCLRPEWESFKHGCRIPHFSDCGRHGLLASQFHSLFLLGAPPGVSGQARIFSSSLSTEFCVHPILSPLHSLRTHNVVCFLY